MDPMTGNAPVPPRPPLPPAPPRGTRRRTVIALAAGAVVLIGATAGITTAIVSDPKGSDVQTKASAPAVTSAAPTSPPVEETTEETLYNPYPSSDDFRIELKTTRKQCFGSAGCNVTVEPDVTYAGVLPVDPSQTISITYEIHGDKSGPIIETMELTDQDQLSYSKVSLSTPDSSTKVTAKVTDVQANELTPVD